MISSIFGKTKPVNFIILLGFLFVFYWFIHLGIYEKAYKLPQLIYRGFVLALLLFSIYAVDFIVKRNQITSTHSYVILYYTLLILIFYKVVLDDQVIFCSLFLLLATRRILSLRSLKEIKHKIFDATVWITISSLFYDWALIYLLLVFLAIYSYEPKNLRNWIVPVVGVGTVALMVYSMLHFTGSQAFIMEHYRFQINLHMDFFAYWVNSTKLIVYMVAIIISGILAAINLGKLGQGKLITMRLLAFSLIIGLFITFVKTSESTFPVLLTFFPAAVLMSQYIEVIKRVKLKEVLLIISITTPFLVLLLDFLSK